MTFETTGHLCCTESDEGSVRRHSLMQYEMHLLRVNCMTGVSQPGCVSESEVSSQEKMYMVVSALAAETPYSQRLVAHHRDNWGRNASQVSAAKVQEARTQWLVLCCVTWIKHGQIIIKWKKKNFWIPSKVTYDCGHHSLWVVSWAYPPQTLQRQKVKPSHVPHRAAQTGGPNTFCPSQNLAACSRGSPIHSIGSFTH